MQLSSLALLQKHFVDTFFIQEVSCLSRGAFVLPIAFLGYTPPPMYRLTPLTFLLLFLLTSSPVAAQEYRVGLIGPAPSYVPGYGRLVHDDSFVTVYDNTGQYSTSTAKYRNRRRTLSSSISTNRDWRDFYESGDCVCQPDAQVPKCYVYDKCTYEDLYDNDGYYPQCDFSGRKDVRYNQRAADRRLPLTVGPLNRNRNYPLGTRDNEQYQNSYNHYDSYWEDEEYGEDNTYEWYDY